MYTETRDDSRAETQPDREAGIRASRLRVPRSRGALSGLSLIVLGAWTALVPFFGPSFDFAYGPNTTWDWTAARGWLEVLPAGVAFFAGLMLLVSSNRVVALMGAWLGAAAGGWLLVGPSLAAPLNLAIGVPNPASSVGARAFEAILYFYGVGAAILFFGSVALGRLSVHGLRDVQAAERRAAAEEAAAREEQERIVAEHEAMLHEVREREAARLQAEQDARREQLQRSATAQQGAPATTANDEEPGRHAAEGESPFFSDDHPVVGRGR
jgi:hypothetical protein